MYVLLCKLMFIYFIKHNDKSSGLNVNYV